MARHKNKDWNLQDHPDITHVQSAILMDIRDELQHLNSILDCKNFREIPTVLRGIRRKLPSHRKS